MLDSIIKVNKKYFAQTLFEECKYIIKRTKMENLVNDDLDVSSTDNVSDNKWTMKVIVSLIVKLMINLLTIEINNISLRINNIRDLTMDLNMIMMKTKIVF